MQKLRDYYNFLKHDCKADYNSRLFSTYAIGYEDTEVYNGPPVKTTISNFIVNQIFPILTLAASRATPHI